MNLDELICPKCKSEAIYYKENNVFCKNCNSIFPIVNGIINFFPEIDGFYEGKFGINNRKVDFYKKWYFLFSIYENVSAFGLRLKHMKYYRTLDFKSRVLDIGCGGGDPFLKIKDFFIVGIDISLSSLMGAKQIYDQVYKVNALSLPFPENSFDCVCSFDLMGHIPIDEKDDFIKEIHRVLKPRGISFHYIEVDSKRGLNNWAKKYPKLYSKYFVKQDGHFGLENYFYVLKRFEKNGFSVLKKKLLAKLFIPPWEIVKLLDNEYKNKNFGVKMLTIFSSIISKNIFLVGFLGCVFKPLQVIFDSLIPDDYGGLLFFIAKNE